MLKFQVWSADDVFFSVPSPPPPPEVHVTFEDPTQYTLQNGAQLVSETMPFGTVRLILTDLYAALHKGVWGRARGQGLGPTVYKCDIFVKDMAYHHRRPPLERGDHFSRPERKFFVYPMGVYFWTKIKSGTLTYWHTEFHFVRVWPFRQTTPSHNTWTWVPFPRLASRSLRPAPVEAPSASGWSWSPVPGRVGSSVVTTRRTSPALFSFVKVEIPWGKHICIRACLPMLLTTSYLFFLFSSSGQFLNHFLFSRSFAGFDVTYGFISLPV